MYCKHVVVIGASAGGVAALKRLISLLPAYFPAPIFIVMHIQSTPISHLPDLMNRYSKLPVMHPVDGQTIELGHIYVAPPDTHMIISDDKIYLRYGPKVNYCRPAIDPLFSSVAYCDTNAIGVLLTGMLFDGAAGMLAIKQHHGITIIQDLDEAEFKEMPENALKRVPIDYCLPIKDIAPLLITLTRE